MTDLRNSYGAWGLITGASSGIGEALARNLARRGVHVLLAARRLPELKRIAIEIRRQGGVATPVRLDVSKTSQLARQLARQLDNRKGKRRRRLDVLIHLSVGDGKDSPPGSVPADDLGERRFKRRRLERLWAL